MSDSSSHGSATPAPDQRVFVLNLKKMTGGRFGDLPFLFRQASIEGRVTFEPSPGIIREADQTPRIDGSQMNLCICNCILTGSRSSRIHSASSLGSSPAAPAISSPFA